ncbi:MAG: GGDEF domain-containing protein [Myxococcota bacterium]
MNRSTAEESSENVMYDDDALVGLLRRENDKLRREVEALRVYRRLAYRDPLTALWNRRYADERLREEVDRARRQAGGTFSVLVIDLNDFKHINDRFGHAVGDEALVTIAGFLRENARDHDICCRTGGDEFTTILPGADEAGCALMVARLRRRLGLLNAERPWPLELSIGQATWPMDGAGAEQLVQAADEAMYADKRRQKNGLTRTRPRQRTSTLPWMGGPAAAK